MPSVSNKFEGLNSKFTQCTIEGCHPEGLCSA